MSQKQGSSKKPRKGLTTRPRGCGAERNTGNAGSKKTRLSEVQKVLIGKNKGMARKERYLDAR